MKYQDFENMNQGWDDGICTTQLGKKWMRENFDIARNVRRKFYSHYDRTLMEPQIGDILELVSCNTYYPRAIVEKVTEHGLVRYCERGSSWTDGEYFSTSGGAWGSKHKCHFEFAGYAYRRYWTWGCHGAGANQGIYFDVLVKRFRQVDMPRVTPMCRIYIGGTYWKKRGSKVVITTPDGYIFKEFETIKRFREWAEYVGLTYHKRSDGTYWTDQFLKDRFFCSEQELPEGCKPIALKSNGSRVLGYVRNDGVTITYFRPNPNAKEVYIPMEEEKYY